MDGITEPSAGGNCEALRPSSAGVILFDKPFSQGLEEATRSSKCLSPLE